MFRPTRRRVEKQILEFENKGLLVIDLASSPYLLKSSEKVSGATNERCYARILNDCDGPISKEHYVSENVLEQIKEIKSDGFPWLKHLDRALSPKELVANCLCKKHNEALAPLDHLAGQFFSKLKEVNGKRDSAIVVWGPSFERWLLKVLLGLIGTKQIVDDRGKVGIDKIPTDWVKILFGLMDFPDGLGLYSANLQGQQLQGGLSFQLLNLHGQLYGLRAKVGPLEFYLSMAQKREAFRADNPFYSQILYHPRQYNFPSENFRIVFHWQ